MHRTFALPYPATKLAIGQYLYVDPRRRFWAWLIVAGFYDAEGVELWHTEIFLRHHDTRGWNQVDRVFDSGPPPPRFALTGRLPDPGEDLTGFNIDNYRVGDRTYSISDGQVRDITPTRVPLGRIQASQQTLSAPPVSPPIRQVFAVPPQTQPDTSVLPTPAIEIPGSHSSWGTYWHPIYGWIIIPNRHY
ncbi:hypothetical protein NKR23_g5336 [Pleurostoma richardsiae]|uniref:Uncharacterized protein n=1 Tax=Pleurostoma richardsiae TaxID=41990 RepID=A0AA38VU34_9PEZI|nr:hypothetical protein NKR23_g5336 [Pleurostoma richardsiae]